MKAELRPPLLPEWESMVEALRSGQKELGSTVLGEWLQSYVALGAQLVERVREMLSDVGGKVMVLLDEDWVRLRHIDHIPRLHPPNSLLFGNFEVLGG